MSLSRHNNSSRTAGKGMLVLSLTTGLVLLTLVFDNLLTRQINPNRNPESIELRSGIREVT
jgi:hypothetical protein